jgi:hypothetical protein
MRPIYLKKDTSNGTRNVVIDMPYLVIHKQIRLPKYYWEDGLYLNYIPVNHGGKVEKYFLTKDKIVKEDEHHYFFNFIFEPKQVENVAV